MGEIGATYMFMQWKLFDKIPSGRSISYKELAASINGEESVVGMCPLPHPTFHRRNTDTTPPPARIGGMLVATGRLVQTSSGHVTHSATSKMFTSESPAGALFLVMLEHGLRGYLHWPEYFARYGVKEATGPTNNPYTVSWGHPETNMWEIIAADEEKQRVFAAGMRTTDSIAGKYGGPASIYSFAWLGDLASAEVKHDKQRALVVDVGGSHGATLKHILEANPSLPAERCVLQDRAEVIEEAIQRDDPALRAVRRMPHDFNHEQPVKGKPPSPFHTHPMTKLTPPRRHGLPPPPRPPRLRRQHLHPRARASGRGPAARRPPRARAHHGPGRLGPPVARECGRGLGHVQHWRKGADARQL